MDYVSRINRKRRIRKIINNVLLYGFIVLIIFWLFLWPVIGTYEIETYSFYAEITDKAVTDKYRSSTKYHIFWCNGEEAGSDRVSESIYARYNIGDLIEIEAIVKQDWFGNQFVDYHLTGN